MGTGGSRALAREPALTLDTLRSVGRPDHSPLSECVGRRPRIVFHTTQALPSTVSAKARYSGRVHLETETFMLSSSPSVKRQPSSPSAKREFSA